MTEDTGIPAATPPAKRGITLDWKSVLILVLVIAVGALVVDRFHKTNAALDGQRTVAVTGEATLHETPDEFVFYPSYQFKDASKDAALAALTKKSEDLTAQLKKLGVTDANIKSSTNGGSTFGPTYSDDGSGKDASYMLQMTITATSSDQAQKVQNYLTTTGPTGQVSPQAQFSDAKRKTLEAKARDEATKDARSKADQSARNLGFTVDQVKSVDDGAGFGGIGVYRNGAVATPMAADGSASDSSLAVQPGLNDITYSVKVVYTIK